MAARSPGTGKRWPSTSAPANSRPTTWCSSITAPGSGQYGIQPPAPPHGACLCHRPPIASPGCRRGEFRTAKEMRAKYPKGVGDLGVSPVWETLAGQPTDDSELGLALARSLAGKTEYDPEAAATAYGRWYRSEPFDCGTTTARAF